MAPNARKKLGQVCKDMAACLSGVDLGNGKLLRRSGIQYAAHKSVREMDDAVAASEGRISAEDIIENRLWDRPAKDKAAKRGLSDIMSLEGLKMQSGLCPKTVRARPRCLHGFDQHDGGGCDIARRHQGRRHYEVKQRSLAGCEQVAAGRFARSEEAAHGLVYLRDNRRSDDRAEPQCVPERIHGGIYDGEVPDTHQAMNAPFNLSHNCIKRCCVISECRGHLRRGTAGTKKRRLQGQDALDLLCIITHDYAQAGPVCLQPVSPTHASLL